MLFRRYHDIFHVLFNAYQRTGLNVAVSSIRHKVFDCLSHARCFLNLVKYDDRFPRIQRYSCRGLKS